MWLFRHLTANFLSIFFAKRIFNRFPLSNSALIQIITAYTEHLSTLKIVTLNYPAVCYPSLSKVIFIKINTDDQENFSSFSFNFKSYPNLNLLKLFQFPPKKNLFEIWEDLLIIKYAWNIPSPLHHLENKNRSVTINNQFSSKNLDSHNLSIRKTLVMWWNQYGIKRKKK